MADATITISIGTQTEVLTVPEIYVSRLVGMLGFFSDQVISRGVGPFPPRRSNRQFMFDPKAGGENNVAFFKRFLKESLLNDLRLVEKLETEEEQRVIDTGNRLIPDIIDDTKIT